MAKPDVSVKCKRCGATALSNTLVLDPDYKMVVCQQCVKEKQLKEKVHKELDAEKKKKLEAQNGIEVEDKQPAGWDKEDEYLERAYKQKQKQQPQVSVQKIDDDKVKYKCPKCSYTFIYSIEKNHPHACPYCGSDIVRTFFP
jgi:DNA-directed RNA polymerase subunit RPC12/RpoP